MQFPLPGMFLPRLPHGFSSDVTLERPSLIVFYPNTPTLLPLYPPFPLPSVALFEGTWNYARFSLVCMISLICFLSTNMSSP